MSKPYKSVSVCGCGWLGAPLANTLQSAGLAVTGSKRSEESIRQSGLEHICLVPFDIFDPKCYSQSHVLFDSDVLVINVPPGRRTVEGQHFANAVKAVVDSAKAGNVKQLIFVSTTSVYGSVNGKVTEQSCCMPDTNSALAHREIETYVLEQFPRTGVVLRLSGLVGEERHPARYLAGREGISSGRDPVNLIHRDDCINAIWAIIAQQRGGEIFHLSATAHPSRADFYAWAADKMQLPAPHFVDEGGEGKWIDPTHTLQTLGITLSYPSPFSMPLPTAV